MMKKKKVSDIMNDRQVEDINSSDCNIQMIFSVLDEAIDDLENGRVISEEEMWKELEAIS